MTIEELAELSGGGRIRDLIDRRRQKRKERKRGYRPIHDENCPPHDDGEDTYTPIIII